MTAWGALAAPQVRSGLARGLAALRQCGAKHLGDGKSAEATVELVIAGGKVSSLQLPGGTGALHDCVQQALRGLRFPAKAAETRATVKLSVGRLDAAGLRRAALIAKIASSGTLKLLGTLGSKKSSVASILGNDSALGSAGLIGDSRGYGGLGLSGVSGGGGGALGIGGLGRGSARGGGLASLVGSVGPSPAERKRLLAGALRIPELPRAPRAPPLLAPKAGASREPFSEATTVALGKDAAIVDVRLAGTRTAHLALDRRAGLLGALIVPDGTRWLGLDGKDAVYAATGEGQLHRAASLAAAASAGAFTPVGRVSGEIAWDSTARLVAALLPDRLALSTAAGRSFREVRVPGAGRLLRLALRHDDVIAVQAAPAGDVQAAGAGTATWLSPDAGRTFTRSAFQPEVLRESGTRIYSESCGARITLSTDKRTWVQAGEGEGRWAQAIDPSSEASGLLPAELPGLLSPAAPGPRSGPRVEGLPRTCASRYRVSGLGDAIKARGCADFGSDDCAGEQQSDCESAPLLRHERITKQA